MKKIETLEDNHEENENEPQRETQLSVPILKILAQKMQMLNLFLKT